MRKLAVSIVMALAVAAFAVPAFATNGDNIIGVGTISRSMGGVGAAAPQDAITAVFGNPAAMCYIPCETSEVDFAATIFAPHVSATVKTTGSGGPGSLPNSSVSADSGGQPYAFPAIGIYTPINENWRFGLAAYGISGLGVDYRGTNLRNSGVGDFSIKTDFQVMKFAPNLAYRILPNLSVGAALQINWAQLDLGQGSAHTFGVGTQVGVLYKPIDPLSIGVTYQSPQSHKFRQVFNIDGALTGDNNNEALKLEQPQQVVLGLAYDIIPSKLLMEVDGKWLNWANADGYKDFDWKDQWVAAVGVQAKPMDWLAVRLGYNYGNNPVKMHNGFTFTNGLAPTTTNLQGTQIPTAQFEGFRIVGFPAIVEQHITAGLGVNITKKVSVNAGYTHAFKKSIQEISQNFFGNQITYKSNLSEDSYEVGLNMMF